MLWIKDFKGHSGCKVQLFNKDGKYFISKSGSTKLRQAAELLISLKKKGFNTPEIYYISDNEVHMEYINGVDMRTFIFNATSFEIDKLIKFIDFYIQSTLTFDKKTISSEVVKKLKDIEYSTNLEQLSFSISELIEKIPSSGIAGLVHGDFTLDNILFFNNEFYLIDANPTDINIVEFDANKIRQDLECLWFVRDQKNKLEYKIVCDRINEHLKNKWEFMNNNYILIFMLMRILPYCKDEHTKSFLILEINKLWQL